MLFNHSSQVSRHLNGLFCGRFLFMIQSKWLHTTYSRSSRIILLGLNDIVRQRGLIRNSECKHMPRDSQQTDVKTPMLRRIKMQLRESKQRGLERGHNLLQEMCVCCGCGERRREIAAWERERERVSWVGRLYWLEIRRKWWRWWWWWYHR